MVNYRGRMIGDIPLQEALEETPKLVNPNSRLVETARGLGVSFGDDS